MFKNYQEAVDWCGPTIIGEEEVLGEVSGWLQREYVLKPTHHYDSREDNGGEGALGAHNSLDT